jgi:CDP-glucose 4,6-dehydratase
MADELVKRGASVVVLERDKVPTSNFYRMGLHRKVKVESGSLEELGVLRRVLAGNRVQDVMHLGAQTIVGTANRSPLPTFEANIMGTLNLLEACRGSKNIERIVVASSDKAYGEGRKLPYTEDMPLMGDYPYDVSKSCADLVTNSYYATYKLPVCITRCGNIYGGGDLNFSRIVPGTIRSTLFGKRQVIRGGGKFVRDYVYVLDIVHAYLMLAEKMEDRRFWGEAFNFSTGNHLTVLEIVDEVLKLMHSDLKPVVTDEAPGEIRNQSLSSEKARRVLGWKPRYGMEKGLKETIAWYKGYFRK